jgi:hypothetical protein
MKVWYANTPLHDYGFLRIGNDRFEAIEKTALPLRQRRFISISIDTPDDTFEANRARIAGLLALVRTNQLAVLRWTSPDEATTYRDGEVRLESHNLPDEGAGGAFFQIVELVFSWVEDCVAPVLTTSFTPLGGAAIALGEVHNFEHSAQTTRPVETNDLRSKVSGQVSMKGALKVAATGTLAARRAALEPLHAAMEAAFMAKSGTLVHGSMFNRVIRVTDYNVRIDQADDVIYWTVTGNFTRFPDEADFAVAEISFRTSEDRQAGSLLATLSGSITATSEAAAITKLTAIQASFLNGFAVLSVETDPQTAQSPDGGAFVRMGYSISARKTSSSIVGKSLRIQESESLADGMVRKTYSGSVTATATTYSAALTAAQTAATSLGGGKHQFALRGEQTYSDNQQTSDRVVTGNFIVTAEFTYEYEVRASREYVEYAATQALDSFGEQTLGVNGVVVAPTLAAAQSRYATLKAGFLTDSYVRNEQTTHRIQEVATNGATASTGETLSGAVMSRFVRFEFTFTAAVRRTAGQNIAVRYSMDTDVDLVRLSKRLSVRGQVGARTRDDAEWATTQVLAALGATGANLLADLVPVRTGSGETRELWLGSRATTADDKPPASATGEDKHGYMTAYSFSREYDGRLTGDNALLECRVSEVLQHSGPRKTIRPRAYARDLVQECGWESGRREISAMAVCASEMVARVWVDQQKGLGFFNGTEAPATRHWLPPRITTSWDAVPRTGLIVRAEDANHRWIQVDGTFTEILPDWDHVPATV